MTLYNKDKYRILLWRIIDDLFWLQSYYNSSANAAEIQALYKNYVIKMQDLIKDTEKKLRDAEYKLNKNEKPKTTTD